MSVWLITGASRGLGREIATAALSAGHTVIAGSRDVGAGAAALPAHPAMTVVELDVTAPTQVCAAVEHGIARYGAIDVLVNNAGYSILGAVEELSDAETLAMFDTNVFGVHRMIRAVLPHMRRKNSGRILNIGSVGGFAAVASSGLYGATKFAVEAITEALDLELKGTGVSATVIEPGAFRTDFLSPRSVRFANVVIDDYAATAGAARQAFSSYDGGQRGDPVKAAAAILTIAGAEPAPLRVQLGADCIARVERKLLDVSEEMGRWRALAESTDFSDVLINE
ncbi:short chain dehydrogenase [Mycolicibacterium rutilum]|uniref:Short chain dehydrogenase n=1 Tax=Mycolicibacterium rutilum TaxID=370526 RepID=A0A1H6IY49_MYCRU|nr:SDR family NAD(P)-dependent oxidoreductase [Mycolicibacterium rutilum]SEH54609.1 short chain dehydrogenase [Mycolicibacterium rutilum]